MKNAIIASKNCKLLLWGVVTAILIVLFALIWIMIWVIQTSPDELNFINITDQTAKLKLIKLIGLGMGGLIAILGVIRLFQRSTLDKQLEKDKSMNPLPTFIKNREFLLWGIIASIIILYIGSIAIIWVIGLPSKSPIFMDIAGSTRIELIKLIGLGMGGLIAILGVLGLFQRGSALDKQNEISEKNYIQRAKEIKESHIHERFKVATEHLGNERDSVRIAAFYEFYHLAEIEQNLQSTIFNILCAHLQQTRNDKYYTNEQINPTEETQSLLKILLKYNSIINKTNANLEEINLQGINLQRINLQGINLQDVNLKKAILKKVNLKKINLQYANLQEANLQYANLQEAKLQYANLQEAKLQYANLQEANLQYANLQEAKLKNANLQKTNLQKTNLQEAFLHGANLHGANLQEAFLQGADLQHAKLQEANLHGANLHGANLHGANLHGANLHGANLQEAFLQEANLQGATINKNNTTMPPNWEKVVKKDENSETGVIFVED